MFSSVHCLSDFLFNVLALEMLLRVFSPTGQFLNQMQIVTGKKTLPGLKLHSAGEVKQNLNLFLCKGLERICFDRKVLH